MKQDDMQQKTKTTVQSHDTALDWSIDQYRGGLPKKTGSYVSANCGRLPDSLKNITAGSKSKERN